MENEVCCPNCGSRMVVPIRKNYDGGLGCLGLLLFGWWGLLLGLLGSGDIEMYCQHCGARWDPKGQGCGCLGAILSASILLFSLILLLALIFLIGFLCLL